jgi:glutathione S-transferase
MSFDSFSHKVTVISSFVLLLKFMLTTTIQGGKRFVGGSRPPEDEKLSLNPKGKTQNFGLKKEQDEKSLKRQEEDMRWQRIVLNDLESLPFGLMFSWISLFSSYSTKVHNIFVISYTIARVLHTYSYAKSLQPHRALCWMVGIVSMLGLGVNSVVGVLTN